MTIETIKRLLDACYQGKRIRICFRRCRRSHHSYIQYLMSSSRWNQNGIHVKISDISGALNLLAPGVTRPSRRWGRGEFICKRKPRWTKDDHLHFITEAGRALSQTYDAEYPSSALAHL